MSYQPTKTKYSGSIKEVKIGVGDKAVTVGGKTCYSFYLFEGEMPNPPKIAGEIWDMDPGDEWSPADREPFKDVLGDSAAWAKKWIDEYGAELIAIQCKSSDPNGADRPADEVAEVVKKVADAIDVPLIVWGTANHDKDVEVLRKVAELCEGKRVVLGPTEEGDYKQIGAAALGYQHVVGASTPIDVNLAKQLNILLENLGVQMENIIMDPTTGGLGYGLEYTYSVMERMNMAALVQQDDKLQLPIFCNMAQEVWKTKEAKISVDEAPQLGKQEKRGILMEAVTAVDLLIAGADIVVIRHPKTASLVKKFIEDMMSKE